MSNNNASVSKSLLFALRVFIICLTLVVSALVLYAAFRSFYDKTESVSVGFPVKNAKTVIIDAGHGGMDGGAVSLTGSLEKDLNLEVAENLKSILEAAGYNVVMTRDGDFMLNSDGTYPKSRKMRDLVARADIVKSHPEAILVSVHMNKFTEEKYSGLQVYYSCNNQKSKELAEGLQALNKLVLQPENNRCVKSAGDDIYILKNADIPAILVECGFLSNYDEARLLDTELYQKKIACLIFSALQRF